MVLKYHFWLVHRTLFFSNLSYIYLKRFSRVLFQMEYLVSTFYMRHLRVFHLFKDYCIFTKFSEIEEHFYKFNSLHTGALFHC